MTKQVSRSPATDGPPRETKTFTVPPMLGTGELWALVEPQVDALPADAVQKPRIDLQAAAECALSVCDDVRDDVALYARFQKQAEAGEWEADGFRRLQRLAGAAWYARRMQLRAESTESEAAVPAALVAEGEAMVGRMLAAATYYLGKNPDVAQVLATINVAPGHRRLANNLHELADLYQVHRDVLQVDTVNYRATDERDARRTASAIVAALADSSTGDAERWGDRCARVWTLLAACYADVQAVGHHLLRKTPDTAKERFPSLVAEARAPSQARKAVDAPEPVTDPVTPANPTDATPVTPRAAAPKRKRRTR